MSTKATDLLGDVDEGNGETEHPTQEELRRTGDEAWDVGPGEPVQNPHYWD